MVDMSKIRCYTCNELGHFATECKKPKQAWKGKESYDELKQKYEALLKRNNEEHILSKEKAGMI